MMTNDQIQAARQGLGIQVQSPTATLPQNLSGDDLANHYLSLGQQNTKQSTSNSYWDQLGNIVPNTVKDFSHAVGDIGTGIQQGGDRLRTGVQQIGHGDILHGAGNVLGGIGGAEIRGLGGGLNAALSPMGELAKGLIPQTGNEWVDTATQGFGVGVGLGGNPLTGLAGAGINLGFKGIDVAEKYLLQNPKIAKLAQDNPDLLPTFNNALNLVVAGLGAKGLDKVGNNILNTDISNMPRAFGENIANTTGAIAQPMGNLARAGMNLGNNVIKTSQDLLTPMNDNVMNVLKNSSQDPKVLDEKLGKLFDQANKANAETGAQTPLDSVGKENLGKALKMLDQQLKDAGTAKETALNATGENPVKLEGIQQNFRQLLADRTGTTLGEEGAKSIEGRVSTLNPTDAKLANQFDDLLNQVSEDPTVRNINDVVDKMQGELYKRNAVGAEPVNTKLQGIIKQTVHNLNEATKTAAGDDYTNANASYADTVELRNELNKRLGTNMKNAGSLMKRVFSPQDGGLKDLFQKIQDKTGVSIFDDATLAKFAMDTVGDPRAKSLLEMEDFSKSGITSRVMNYLLDKVSNPESKAHNILQERSAENQPKGGQNGANGPQSNSNGNVNGEGQGNSHKSIISGLKETVNKAKNDQSGFVKLPGGLGPEDEATLNDFLDYVSGKYNPKGKEAVDLEIAARRIVAKAGGSPEKGNSALASQINKVWNLK